jgi:hypothetical protein
MTYGRIELHPECSRRREADAHEPNQFSAEVAATREWKTKGKIADQVFEIGQLTAVDTVTCIVRAQEKSASILTAAKLPVKSFSRRLL